MYYVFLKVKDYDSFKECFVEDNVELLYYSEHLITGPLRPHQPKKKEFEPYYEAVKEDEVEDFIVRSDAMKEALRLERLGEGVEVHFYTVDFVHFELIYKSGE